MNQVKKTKWTSEEDAQLAIYMAQNLKAEKIAKLMGRSVGAIYNRKMFVEPAKGLEPIPSLRNDNSVWNDHQISVLRSMVMNGKNTKEISEALGRTPNAIYTQKWKMKMNDVRITSTPRTAQQEDLDPMEEIKTGIAIPANLVGVFIGREGCNIKEIQQKHGIIISISEGIATVKGARVLVNSAIEEIKQMLIEPKVGDVFDAVALSIKEFGTFFRFGTIHQGLMHISKYDCDFQPGQSVKVKIDHITPDGKVQVSLVEEKEQIIQETFAPLMEEAPKFDINAEMEKMAKELSEKTGKKIAIAAYFVGE
jgi:predicted RNA-binding protein with RPS1 domain/transposase